LAGACGARHLFVAQTAARFGLGPAARLLLTAVPLFLLAAAGLGGFAFAALHILEVAALMSFLLGTTAVFRFASARVD
jgi:hypothetical protein